MLETNNMINGKIMCTQFKTSKHYRFQAICPSVIVDTYIKYFRVNNNSDRLFVNSRGDALKQGMINKGNIVVALC